MKTIVWFGFVLCALSASGKVFVAKKGQKTTLECGVNTFSDTVVWNRENDLLCSTPKVQRMYNLPRTGKSDTAGRSRIRPETKLDINGVKMEDAGKFICKADGKSYQHTLLVVIVSASASGDLLLGSEVTLKCEVSGLNPDSTVQWERPDGRSHAGSHTGSQAELKSVARSDAGTWKCTFSYDGTTHMESLEIKVQELKATALPPTQAAKDNSKSSVTHPKPGHTLLGLRWWMWVAIGVGCLFVLLLIVLIVVLCQRNKRRKRKFRSMKNGGLPMKPKNYCQCNRPAAAAKPQQGRRREKPSAPPLQPLLME